MQNHMREIIDQGMGELQSKQGKGGLPSIPASASAAPVKAPFAASAPGPEPNVAAEINQQAQAADQAETAALQELKTEPGPSDSAAQVSGPVLATESAPSPPPTISLGQSIESVTAAIGTPVRIVDLGAKKIYVYKDMKITFTGGKASNIQ